MQYAFNAAGVGEALVRSFKIGATVIAGQVVIWDINGPGDIQDASTTAAADAFGVTLGGGTYTTTQGTGSSSANVEVEVVASPLGVFRAAASGGAGNSALATTAPSNVLTNTTASAGGTLITAAEVGTVSFAAGTVFGLTGSNAGASRIITAHSNSTSTTVTVPFDYALAVNDKFVRLPWAPGVQAVQLTTTLDQADAIIVTGTGIASRVWGVELDRHDDDNPTAAVYFQLGDHSFNPLS